MVLELSPAPAEILEPTPGRLADLVTVELATGGLEPKTMGADTYGAYEYGGRREWQTWTCDITSLRIERGRQRTVERNSPGMCTFTAVQMVPAEWLATPPTGRPARIRTVDGRTMFAGIIEVAELQREYGTATWTVSIFDDLARLGRLEVSSLVRPVEDVGARVDALTTAAGMIAPGVRYGVRVQAVNGSDRKVLDELGIAVDSWRWNLSPVGASAVVDRRGGFSITDTEPPAHGGRWRASPDAGTATGWLGDVLGFTMGADLADVVNYVTYANAGGAAIVTEHNGSILEYGPRSYQRLDFVAANGGGHVADDALEQWATATIKPTPAQRIRSMTVDVWHRPAGGVPLLEVLAELDVGHDLEVDLPGQDDTGGPVTVTTTILGIAWDLAETDALLVLTVEAPIDQTAAPDMPRLYGDGTYG